MQSIKSKYIKIPPCKARHQPENRKNSGRWVGGMIDNLGVNKQWNRE